MQRPLRKAFVARGGVVLYNVMIDLAMLMVYDGRIKDDLGNSLAMIMGVFVFALLGFEHSVANTVLIGCCYAYTNDDKQSERTSLPHTKSGATMWAHRNPYAIPLVKRAGTTISHIPPPKGSHVGQRTNLWTQ